MVEMIIDFIGNEDDNNKIVYSHTQKFENFEGYSKQDIIDGYIRMIENADELKNQDQNLYEIINGIFQIKDFLIEKLSEILLNTKTFWKRSSIGIC